MCPANVDIRVRVTGGGHTSQIYAVRQAIAKAGQFNFDLHGAVLASDAFFPFTDSIDLIHQGGIRWVIQPGGSMRDEEVFARAKELGVTLVLTGQRHFRH